MARVSALSGCASVPSGVASVTTAASSSWYVSVPFL